MYLSDAIIITGVGETERICHGFGNYKYTVYIVYM